jgi:hypothetical protein
MSSLCVVCIKYLLTKNNFHPKLTQKNQNVKQISKIKPGLTFFKKNTMITNNKKTKQ